MGQYSFKKEKKIVNPSILIYFWQEGIMNVITAFRSTWMTTKIKMESPPIFS